MPESYRYRITQAVDAVKIPIFNTSHIKYLAAATPLDLMFTSASIILKRMKCVKEVKNGTGEYSSEWTIKFDPGRKCKGCPYYKKWGDKKRCARRENAIPKTEQSTSFQES